MAKTSISVDHVARVEGHGDIHVVIEDGVVKTCELSVVEPARLFESMVRARPFEEVPYIASRVCGICSSSHVVTDLRAIEQIFGVEVTDRTRARCASFSCTARIFKTMRRTCSCSPLPISSGTKASFPSPSPTAICSSGPSA